LGTIPGTVFTLGDNVYTYGTAAEFRNCYGPTWGKYKDRTPAPTRAIETGSRSFTPVHDPGAALLNIVFQRG
jgi:hypothetical protein